VVGSKGVTQIADHTYANDIVSGIIINIGNILSMSQKGRSNKITLLFDVVRVKPFSSKLD
jgi:hypothetical protein